jgi:FkbM family methyltransferase
MWTEFKKKLASILAKMVPKAVLEQSKYLNKASDYAQIYYSQEGEEIILRRYFQQRNTGFFVDIGAHHPQKFSNTYKLYLLGWRGINIDATPGSMELFKLHRPKDINVECAIGDTEDEFKFYEFDEPALNTFNKEKVDLILKETNFKLSNTRHLKTHKLETVLAQHIDENTNIDFFSIDAEGFDFKVLKGNNWNKFRPEVILIETNFISLNDLEKDQTFEYLKHLGYYPFAKTYKTVFYSCKSMPNY